MTDNPALPETQWVEDFFSASQNPECGHLITRDLPSLVRLSDLGAQRVRLSFVARTGIGLIHNELREVLEPQFSSRFIIRPVQSGQNNDAEWRAYIDPMPVFLRGAKASYCRKCPVCHEIIYDPLGQWNLLADGYTTSTLVGTHYGGIVIGRMKRDLIGTRKWAGVSIRPLPVSEQPVDGFPSDLTKITPSEERLPAFLRRVR